MTIQEACKRADEIYEQIKADEEAHRLAEFERNRQMFYTSIVCAHRGEQEYIEASDFDLMLCPDCVRDLSMALRGHEV